MSFLPIVERELRISSRKSGTHLTRWGFVGAGLLVWFFLLATSSHSMPTHTRAKMLFAAVGVLAFAFSLLAGVFLTADCLSQEKREGTLGLLFLTNLKGYDVVLGKLIATSLNAFYGVLAVLPLLSLPLLMGGVSISQFWRVNIALITTLLLSLSIGMLISSFARDTRTAVGLTLLVLAVLAGLPPAIWALGKAYSVPWTLDSLLEVSPGYLYAYAHDSFYRHRVGHVLTNFGLSLIILLSLALISLAAASFRLKGSWQEKGETTASPGSKRTGSNWRYLRRPLGSDLLALDERNPCYWLFYRDRLPRSLSNAVLGILAGVWLCFVPGCFSNSWAVKDPCFTVLMFMAFGMHLLLKVFVAAEATRRLNEDRRSGALELLLVTPITIRQITSAQRLALQNIFRWPTAIVALLNVVLLWLMCDPNPLNMRGEERFMMCEVYVGGIVMLLIDARSLGWVGMFMGLRKRRHHWAIFAALASVLVGPWVGIFLFIFIAAHGRGPRTGEVIVLTFFYFLGCAALNAALIGWVQNSIASELREINSAQTPRFMIAPQAHHA